MLAQCVDSLDIRPRIVAGQERCAGIGPALQHRRAGEARIAALREIDQTRRPDRCRPAAAEQLDQGRIEEAGHEVDGCRLEGTDQRRRIGCCAAEQSAGDTRCSGIGTDQLAGQLPGSREARRVAGTLAVAMRAVVRRELDDRPGEHRTEALRPLSADRQGDAGQAGSGDALAASHPPDLCMAAQGVEQAVDLPLGGVEGGDHPHLAGTPVVETEAVGDEGIDQALRQPGEDLVDLHRI